MPPRKRKNKGKQTQRASPYQPSALAATLPQPNEDGSSQTKEEDLKKVTPAIITPKAVPIRDRSPEPPKLPKPRCVRISALPGDITERELKDWLLTLKPSQKAGNYKPSSSTTRLEKPTNKFIQFNLARNGETKQATATFTVTPAIFDQAERETIIEDDGKPWHHAVADTHFEGMTMVYAPPEGTHIQAE